MLVFVKSYFGEIVLVGFFTLGHHILILLKAHSNIRFLKSCQFLNYLSSVLSATQMYYCTKDLNPINNKFKMKI